MWMKADVTESRILPSTESIFIWIDNSVPIQTGVDVSSQVLLKWIEIKP